MDLRREDDLPEIGARLTCRDRALPYVLMCGILVGAAVLWGVVAVRMHGEPLLPRIVFGLFGLLSAGIFLLLLPHTLRRFGPHNWLLKVGPDALLLKFRSPGNAHFPPEDPVVVYLARGEIRSFARVTIRSTVPDDEHGTTRRKTVFLDVHLHDADTRALEAALARERALPAMGSATSKSKEDYYPVSVPAPGVIRIRWGGYTAAVRPSLRRALAYLERLAPVDEPLALDAGDWNRMSPGELEDYVQELVRAGDFFSAVQIARLRYGYNLTQAKAFVDELAGRAPAPT